MASLSALQPGRPWPLGASWDGAGVNFAVFSAHAQAVDLCLFDEPSGVERSRTALPGHTDAVWHGYLPGAAPGPTGRSSASCPFRFDDGGMVS